MPKQATRQKSSVKKPPSNTPTTISLSDKEKALIAKFADELGLSNSKAIVKAVKLASKMLDAQEKGEEIIFREPETNREKIVFFT